MSDIYIAPVIERIKANIEEKWKAIPDGANYTAHARTMIDGVNEELIHYVKIQVENRQEDQFIACAVKQFDGLARGNILHILKARIETADKEVHGMCLVDIVRDVLAKIAIQDLAVRGVKLGYFTQSNNGSINLTPNKPI